MMMTETTPIIDPLVGAYIEYAQKKVGDVLSCIVKRVQFQPIENPKSEYLVPMVTALVKSLSEDVIYTKDGFRVYNLRHWEFVDDMIMGQFLREVALKAGVPKRLALPHWSVESMVKQARYDLFADFKSNRNIANFRNLVIEIDTLTTREHRREDYQTDVLNFNFDPKAEYPRFLQFLDEVLPEISDQMTAQEAAALGLCHDVNIEKFLVFVGVGKNGKSVLLGLIADFYGRNNVTGYSISQMSEDSGIYIGSSKGKRLNVSTENSVKIKNMANFKALVSHEDMTCKLLYQQPTITQDYPPTIAAMNNRPVTDDFSNGFYRRWQFLNFDVVIPDEKTDTELAQKLKAEMSGIANWIIEGARRLRQQKRFTQSQRSADDMVNFRKESDPVALWIDEQNYVPSALRKELLSDLFKSYQRFTDDNGFGSASRRTVADRLRFLGFKVAKSTGGNIFVWCDTASSTTCDDDSSLPF